MFKYILDCDLNYGLKLKVNFLHLIIDYIK